MKFKLHVWRQKSAKESGKMESYDTPDVSPNASFLEMLDVVNEDLTKKGMDTIAFDHDCREGICGSCSLVINGKPHGPEKGTTCQLHMRSFKDGSEICIEPFRAKAFPVIKDLATNRTAFDRIIQKGGFVSISTGGAPDGNTTPIPKRKAEKAFDTAQCIGCGACVAACKNASAMLFVSAKVAHLGHLPQGQAERYDRVMSMVSQMDSEGFGNCTNQFECQAACPKDIDVQNIAMLNRDYLGSSFKNEE